MAWDWGKKLGGQPAPPPSPPSPYGPAVLPRGMGVNHGDVIDHYMASRGQVAPQDPYRTVVTQAPQEWQPVTDGSASKVGEVLPIWQWQGDPRGAASEHLGGCPHCGGPRYIQGKTGGRMMKDGSMAYPAPTCFDCGYPNEQGILAGAATTSGPAMAARGAEAAAPPNSMAFVRK